MNYQMASGVGSMLSAYFTTSAANSIAKTQAATANFIRGENNKVLAAENARDKVLTGLQRWRQEVANKRVMANAAANQEVLAVNHWRGKDQRARGSFSEQIRYAEEAGRMQAQAGASGVTGGVVDMLNFTVKMKKGMEDTARANNERLIDYDHMRKSNAVWWADMDQIDYSLILDNPRVADMGNDIAFKSNPMLAAIAAGGKQTLQGYANFQFNTGSFSGYGRQQPDTFGEGEY